MNLKKVFSAIISIIVMMMISLSFSLPSYAVPLKPSLKNDPINGQKLPMYDVWLRWNDSPDEAYYSMTLRNLSTNTLIYDQKYISPNSTYFIVPASVLDYGVSYRWCLRAHDSSGGAKCADAHVFTIERYCPSDLGGGVTIARNDPHLYSGGFSSASKLEYFIYAKSTWYESILKSAAQAWNGISSNVNLIATGYPTDGKYEMGIFESPSPSAKPYSFGHTELKVGGENGRTATSYETYDYAEIWTYYDNIKNFYDKKENIKYGFIIPDIETYLKSNASHEIGHALSLIHTDLDPHRMDLSTETGNTIPLIMNQNKILGGSLNVVDRDHLRLKWGA